VTVGNPFVVNNASPPDAGAGWSGGFQCSDPIDAFFWLFLGLQDFGERKGLL
jgi:hypothetical protein